MSDTWEGREGRLFAYELIFKYLIKNHWLYTFGPAGSGIQGDEKNTRYVEELTHNFCCLFLWSAYNAYNMDTGQTASRESYYLLP